MAFAFFAIVAAMCGVGMYFFWYRNLKSEEECEREDSFYEGMPTAGFK